VSERYPCPRVRQLDAFVHLRDNGLLAHVLLRAEGGKLSGNLTGLSLDIAH